MLGNENLAREEILQAHKEAAVKRMARHGGTILAIQGTMRLNYNAHKKTEGIGYTGGLTLGVNIHSCLAVTADGKNRYGVEGFKYNEAENHYGCPQGKRLEYKRAAKQNGAEGRVYQAGLTD